MSKKKKRYSKHSKTKKIMKKTLDLGVFLLIVLLITYVLSTYVVERVVINNYSMEPTVSSGDSVLIDKLSYRFSNPVRFDVIVFKQNNTGEELIKRVIGLPNETVEIKDGLIYINGNVIKDTVGVDPPQNAGDVSYPVHLSDNEYFVIGDNRKDSIDSRYEEIGLVIKSKIIGKAFVKLFPIAEFRGL